MIYEFVCDGCGDIFTVDGPAFTPPVELPQCYDHGGFEMRRLYSAQIDTSGCKDHDFIPETQRVADTVQPFSGEKKGRIFSERINERRKTYAQDGQRGEIRHTHSVPADLYHGKIKETGDKQYWNDPANMKKHESCRVDK